MSHADGTIIVYDREREDGTFTPQDPTSTAFPAAAPSATGASALPSSAGTSTPPGSGRIEWNPLHNIFVTMPPWHPVIGGGNGKTEKDKTVKNPVSHWRVSRRSVVGEGLISFHSYAC